jgi:hypothetical protein
MRSCRDEEERREMSGIGNYVKCSLLEYMRLKVISGVGAVDMSGQKGRVF